MNKFMKYLGFFLAALLLLACAGQLAATAHINPYVAIGAVATLYTVACLIPTKVNTEGMQVNGLCTVLTKYKQATCAGVSGGIAQIYIFDPSDFDFTQASPVSSVIQPYTAIADLTTGHKLYGINFQRNQAEYSFKQSSKGGYSTKYEHQLMFIAPDLSMLTASWNTLVDKAGICCGVGMVIVLNSGRILIIGEGSVNAAPLAVPSYAWQDGSSGSSGKAFDDVNGNTVMLKGDYNRAAIEFTGGITAITALAA